MKLDSEDQTDYEQAISHDWRRRGRIQSKGVEDEFFDIIGQRLALLEHIPGAVEEDVCHPGVVWNGEREVLPVHGFAITEDTIDDTESGFQVRFGASLVAHRTHDRVSGRDGLEECFIGFVAGASTLDREVEKGLGADISLFLELWNDHRTSV